MKMRLIDEDVLVRESLKILTWLMERQKQGISTTLGELHEKWIDSVRKAPTAYDPDKVVEELDKLADKANDKILEASELQLYYDGYDDAMRTAVEIVKGGGVDGN